MDPERATFPAQPGSVAGARRLVRDHLLAAGAKALEDEAVLVVSELVANAVLHAGGPIEVTVAVDVGPPLTARLSVVDDSPVAPTVRHYGSGASTGRGLGLVARLASRWGMDSVGDSAKVVWAEVTAEPGDGEPIAPESTMPANDPAVHTDATGDLVRFLGVPVALYLRLQEQNDAVLRELELLAFTADHAGGRPPSSALMDVIERSRRYFNRTREGFRLVVSGAGDRGEATVDLHASFTPESVAPSAAYVSLFEEAEELAAAGELLVAPAPADVARLRRWFVAEMTAQLAGSRSAVPFDTGA